MNKRTQYEYAKDYLETWPFGSIEDKLIKVRELFNITLKEFLTLKNNINKVIDTSF